MNEGLISSRNPVFSVADYFVKLGEAVVLCVFFQVAANNTESLLIEVANFLAHCAVGAFVGAPVGFFLIQANRIRTRKLWVALSVALPLAMLWGWAAFEIGHQISETVNQIAFVAKA